MGREARNANANAQTAVSSANNQIATAQAALDAAKRAVADAKADYDDAARTVVTKIQSAKDAGVRADTWWEAVYHSDAWKTLIDKTIETTGVRTVGFAPTIPQAALENARGLGVIIVRDTDDLLSFLKGIR